MRPGVLAYLSVLVADHGAAQWPSTHWSLPQQSTSIEHWPFRDMQHMVCAFGNLWLYTGTRAFRSGGGQQSLSLTHPERSGLNRQRPRFFLLLPFFFFLFFSLQSPEQH
jgi:hypothetical protein